MKTLRYCTVRVAFQHASIQHSRRAVSEGVTAMLSGVEWSGVEWSGLEWIGLVWSGVEWIGVDWIGLEWSGVERIGLEWRGGEYGVERTQRSGRLSSFVRCVVVLCCCVVVSLCLLLRCFGCVDRLVVAYSLTDLLTCTC